MGCFTLVRKIFTTSEIFPVLAIAAMRITWFEFTRYE